MSKLNLSYPDDETHASVQRGEFSPTCFFLQFQFLLTLFCNSAQAVPGPKLGPGPSRARTQAGPRPKPGSGPSRARVQTGPGPKPGPGPSRTRAQAGRGPKLCYAMLCYATLYYTLLYYTILCWYTMRYDTTRYSIFPIFRRLEGSTSVARLKL